MAGKLIYREGFVTRIQQACGTGMHRSVRCQTATLKSVKGGFARTAIIRGPYVFRTNQKVKWYETMDGMVMDVLAR